MDYEIYFKAFELQNINIGKTFFLNKNFWIKTKFTDENLIHSYHLTAVPANFK